MCEETRPITALGSVLRYGCFRKDLGKLNLMPLWMLSGRPLGLSRREKGLSSARPFAGIFLLK